MATLPARHPCGFCRRERAWPDECPGTPPDEICLDEVPFRHEVGDHRRCLPADCKGAVLIAEVASLGKDFCERTGKSFAVVDTFANPWHITGFNGLQQAKPYRSRIGKKHAGKDAWSVEFKGDVIVVRADGSVV